MESNWENLYDIFVAGHTVKHEVLLRSWGQRRHCGAWRFRHTWRCLVLMEWIVRGSRRKTLADDLLMKVEFDFESRGVSEAVTVAVTCGLTVSSKESQT